MPQPKRKQRRVNPDKTPWNQLPIIVFNPDPNHVETPMTDEDWARVTEWLDSPERHAPYDPEKKAVITGGVVTVTRGTFDIADLPARCLSLMEQHPGEEYVITTDGLGRLDVDRRGALIDADLADPANTAWHPHLPAITFNRDDPNATLTGWADALRENARRALEVADQYDALAADGWEIVPTMPEPVYYPPPLRRRPAQDES